MSDRSDDDVSDPETDSIIERAVQSIESARKGKSQPQEVVTITEPVKVKKPRKPPTPAMLAALAKGREKRLESAEISRLQRLEILRERRLEKKVGGKAPVENIIDDSAKKPRATKPKPKPEPEYEEDSDDEPTPPKAKVKVKAPEKANVEKVSQGYLDGYLRL